MYYELNHNENRVDLNLDPTTDVGPTVQFTHIL